MKWLMFWSQVVAAIAMSILAVSWWLDGTALVERWQVAPMALGVALYAAGAAVNASRWR